LQDNIAALKNANKNVYCFSTT